MFEFWYAFPFAIAVATMAMMVGVGGGILFVPFFIFAGLSPHEAIGTALITEIFGMSSGTFRYLKQDLVLKNIVIPFILLGILGVIVGTYFAFGMDGSLLKKLFGLFAVVVSIFIFLSIRNGDHGERTSIERKEAMPFLWVPFLAAICTGMFSIGSGALNVVLFERKFKVVMHRAVATGVVLLASAATVGTFLHWQEGEIVSAMALFTIPGVVIGGQIGPYIAKNLNAEKLKGIFAVIVLLTGISMLLIS